jgi:hypothetical protein
MINGSTFVGPSPIPQHALVVSVNPIVTQNKTKNQNKVQINLGFDQKNQST